MTGEPEESNHEEPFR